MEQYKQGDIVWTDLTVPNAKQVRDFYKAVTGWEVQPLSMGEYDDYVMKTAEGTAVAGVCHTRGSNTNMPPQWMVYVAVEDVAGAAKQCTEMGGKVLDGPRKMGDKDFACIQDPAGAVLALISI
ncbi:VOC family protein [Polluticoccus soli]|uniref:VOC family protein n=1 Tax=Polluticoccus soli TaxID=3034150 RepID=UPI0023E096E1|nr:VOC family protein [Flavipsychrobacter sp. JY13-12]